MGVDRETAHGAVSAAFGEVNEDQLLEDALARRLRGASFPTERAAVNRLQGWLLRQGFDSDKVRQLLRRRSRSDGA